MAIISLAISVDPGLDRPKLVPDADNACTQEHQRVDELLGADPFGVLDGTNDGQGA